MFQKIKDRFNNIPRWRLWLYAALGVFVLMYLAWCHFHKPAPTAQVFTQTAPAVSTPKVPGPVITVPIKVVPKAAVVRKFPQYHDADSQTVEVIDTSEIPQTDNGGTTITAIDATTGEAATSFKPNPAPWFAFQAKNYIGAGVEAGTAGTRGTAYYKRDILRVKDIYLQIKPAEIKVPITGGNVEFQAGAYAEWRW